MFEKATPLNVDENLSFELERVARSKHTHKDIALRCWIVVMAGLGISNYSISKTLHISRPTVLLWRMRFEVFGKDCILNPKNSAPGRPKAYQHSERKQIAAKAAEFINNGYSLREVAQKLLITKSTLHRIIKEKK